MDSFFNCWHHVEKMLAQATKSVLTSRIVIRNQCNHRCLPASLSAVKINCSQPTYCFLPSTNIPLPSHQYTRSFYKLHRPPCDSCRRKAVRYVPIAVFSQRYQPPKYARSINYTTAHVAVVRVSCGRDTTSPHLIIPCRSRINTIIQVLNSLSSRLLILVANHTSTTLSTTSRASTKTKAVLMAQRECTT